MRELFRPAMLICLVLLIPLAPFFFVGEERIESWINYVAGRETPHSTLALILFGLLASDIILPVPSSVVNTLAGWQLGTFWGTIVCWAGMSVGAVSGFWLARWCGPVIVNRFSRQKELERTKKIIDRFGPFALIIVRGVPVLAEASVLLTGMHRLAWNKFWPPVLLANFCLATTYAAFGDISQAYGMYSISLAAAIVLPVILLILFKRIFE